MADDARDSSEPLFRATKRRRIFRQRTDEEQTAAPSNGAAALINRTAGSDIEHGDESVSAMQRARRPASRKQGIAFTSTSTKASQPYAPAMEPSDETALVPLHPERAQQMAQVDRFVKPTGKVAVVDDKHMYVGATLRRLEGERKDLC